MREHFTCLLRHAEAAGGCAIARGDNVLAEASEAPEALPLKHPAMVAIEQVAAKVRQRPVGLNAILILSRYFLMARSFGQDLP